MSTEFEREERYIVIKRKDLKFASVEAMLRQVLDEQHIPTRGCVVIESDWPEYEPVWKMLEYRMTGKPNELAALRQKLEAAEKDAERYRWLTNGKRRSYIANNVLSDEEWGNAITIEQAIDAAIAAGRKS